MKYTGMKFFMDLVDVEYDQILAAFSFYSGYAGFNIVYPEKWSGSNSATGYLNTTTSSFYGNGTGIFNGSLTMSLSGQNFALTEDSTLFMSFQKLRTGNEILLSSTTGNSFDSYQGYCLGVNDANKLYFKYWNPVEGPFTFTYSKILSDKNLIVLNRTNSVLTIGRYDNNNFEYDLEEFFIYENAFKNNEYGNLFLGGSRNNFDWANNGARNFSGYIDKFYFFNNTPFIYKNILTSGLYSVATGYEGFSETFCFETGFYDYSGFSYSGQTGVFVSGFTSGITGVTGYITGISGYSYSGVTGYSGKYLGTSFDNCGNPKDFYEQIPLSGLISGNYSTVTALTGTLFITGAIDIPLTGFISGSGLIEVTGEVCDTIFTLTGEALYDVDLNYLSSLSYSEISLLSNIDQDNIVEFYYSPYEYNTKNFNTDLDYDNVDNNFYSPNFDISDKNILLFAQGQALTSSGGTLIQSGYELIPMASLDYFTTGNNVEVNNNFNETNQLFYDYYKDRPNYYFSLLTGSKSGDRVILAPSSPETGLEKSFIFKNGQKLLSGVDYTSNPLILAVGVFTTFKNFSNNRIVSINNSGTIDNYFKTLGGFNLLVRDCILDNNQFIAVGNFSSYQGSSARRIARINPSGNLDTTFTGFVNTVNLQNAFTICKYKDQYIIGGSFTGCNNIEQNYISRFNYDGSLDTSFILPGAGFSSNVNKIVVDKNNNIYVGGSFTGYNGLNANKIVKLNHNGSIDTSFNKGGIISGNEINTIYLDDDSIFIGGDFTGVNGDSRYSYLAKLDYNGNLISGFKGTGISGGSVAAIEKDKNNNILIGGNFLGVTTDTGFVEAPRFLVLNNSGVINNIYNPLTGFSTSIFTINLQNDGKILIGGNFSSFRGLSYSRALRFNSDYTVDNNFISIGPASSGFNAGVYKFIPYDAIQLNNDESGNNLFMAKEHDFNFKFISGNTGFFNTLENYNNNSSLVFLNGIRQKLNNNYVENSKLDLISGSFYEPGQKNVIYNNTDDFFV
jgi:hypothetical protein